jgi:hypothetical protein
MKLTFALAVVIALLTFALSSGAQVPPAKCRADYDYWTAHMPDIPHLPFDELQSRAKELTQCFADTVPAKFGDDEGEEYVGLASFYWQEAAKRLGDFLDKHHLTAQFLGEDGAMRRPQ